MNELLQLLLDHHVPFFVLAGIGLYIWGRRTGPRGTSRRRRLAPPAKKRSPAHHQEPRHIFTILARLGRSWRSKAKRPANAADVASDNKLVDPGGHPATVVELQGRLTELQARRQSLAREITALEADPAGVGPRQSNGSARAGKRKRKRR